MDTSDLKQWLQHKWWVLKENYKYHRQLKARLDEARCLLNAEKGLVVRYSQSCLRAEERLAILERLLKDPPAKRLLQEAAELLDRGSSGLQINRYEIRTWLHEYMIYRRDSEQNNRRQAD